HTRCAGRICRRIHGALRGLPAALLSGKTRAPGGCGLCGGRPSTHVEGCTASDESHGEARQSPTGRGPALARKHSERLTMPRIPLPNHSYEHLSKPVGVERLVNCMAEKAPPEG